MCGCLLNLLVVVLFVSVLGVLFLGVLLCWWQFLGVGGLCTNWLDGIDS